MGITRINGFMDICLLRTWSRAREQITFRPAHRAQADLVSNGLHRADETDPRLVQSLPCQTRSAEVSGAPHCTVGPFLLPPGCMVHLEAFWEDATWAQRGRQEDHPDPYRPLG